MTRLVILTGATGGIGSSILRGLEGGSDMRVCVLTRNGAFQREGITSITADFSQPGAGYADELAAWIDGHRDIGEIALVLAAASIGPINAIGSFGVAAAENIQINVTSQIRVIDTVVKCAQKNKAPVRIIQFDSGAAYRPIGGWALYCASKAYVSMFLKVLASEHKEYKIVLFDPGVVDTGMQKTIRDADSDAFTDRDYFKSLKDDRKLRDPGDVAKVVLDRYIWDWKAKQLNERCGAYEQG